MSGLDYEDEDDDEDDSVAAAPLRVDPCSSVVDLFELRLFRAGVLSGPP